MSTFRYTTRPGGYAHLKKLITSKWSSSARQEDYTVGAMPEPQPGLAGGVVVAENTHPPGL
jgi:hypothetical protein